MVYEAFVINYFLGFSLMVTIRSIHSGMFVDCIAYSVSSAVIQPTYSQIGFLAVKTVSIKPLGNIPLCTLTRMKWLMTCWVVFVIKML